MLSRRPTSKDTVSERNSNIRIFFNSWKILQELIFANHQFWKIQHFRKSKKEFIFVNLAQIREICEILFPRKFLPLR